MEIVTIEVIYYRPDYRHLVNSFVWQTEDYVPDLPRLTKFMRHFITLCTVQKFIICHNQRRIIRKADYFDLEW